MLLLLRLQVANLIQQCPGTEQSSLFHHLPSECATAAGVMSARPITKKVLSVEQAEGVGARVRRSVGRPEVSHAHPCKK